MLPTLPADPPISATNQVLGDVPPDFWPPVLAALRTRLDLPPGPVARLPSGKNVVFPLGDTFLKLIPPCWTEDAGREAAALRALPADGPVAIPVLLAQTTLDGWTALLLQRVPGLVLATQWRTLARPQRIDLAAQLGAVAAWLHSVAVPPGSPLIYDWAAHLAADVAAAPRHLTADGVPAALQTAWPTFLASVGLLPGPGDPTVLLHGDLSMGNVVVQEQQGRLRLTGLLDFGDSSQGQAIHDWLSPGIHNFGGDPAVLAAFCDGYDLPAAARLPALQAQLLARSVLYYRWSYLQYKFPAVVTAPSWDAIAAVVWPLTGEGGQIGEV